MKHLPLKSPAVFAIIFANSIPLIGGVFFGWSLFEVVFIYWAESAVIGFYSIFKLIITTKFAAFFNVPFFIVHYSGFMLAHLVFIFAILQPDIVSNGSFFPSFPTILNLVSGVGIALIGLLLSHGFSFLYNFIYKQEYKKIKGNEQMFLPYARIVIMHLAIVFGGGISLIFGEPQTLLVLLIVLKTFVDILAHSKIHRKIQGVIV
jgi:hypothetical protein